LVDRGRLDHGFVEGLQLENPYTRYHPRFKRKSRRLRSDRGIGEKPMLSNQGDGYMNVVGGVAMDNERSADTTFNVLISIRDEMKALREDTNKRFEQIEKRFEQIDKRFERIEKDISVMRDDIRHIVTKFDRDYLVLASDLDTVKKRLQVCEQHLGIKN
jgi:hypothetical protein